jgi:Kef-type K+ transport system membrane component KefB
MLAVALSPDLHELEQILPESAQTARTMMILLQVALLLAGAKVLGAVAERCKIQGVIGELMAGVLLGPYLLGSAILVPLHGEWVPLFPAPHHAGQWPISPTVWTITQFASVILLFVTGLHTDLRQFLKYLWPASMIAIVGLLLPFALGVGVTAIPPFAHLASHNEGWLVPALFVGTILAATSIGITARVLGDIGKLDTPEGVTILGAAVLDDVLGIVALAIVGGIASSGEVSVGGVSLIAIKAIGFWIILTALILLLSKPIERLLMGMKYGGAMLGLALAAVFVCAAAAEGFGLAFIIGAYSVGLGLSRTAINRILMEKLEPLNDFFVPIFFASLGMLVNLQAIFASWEVIVFGLVVTLAAVIGKVIGCGGAALRVGFNARGGYRIGLGMMPRGEVALIVAGIGFARQIVGEVVFGVSIMMTLITTILAPLLLVPAFARGGSGRKEDAEKSRAAGVSPESSLPSASDLPAFVVTLNPNIAKPFASRLLTLAESQGWQASYDDADENLYLLRSGDCAAAVKLQDGKLSIDASDVRRAELIGMAERVRAAMVADAVGIAINAANDDGVIPFSGTPGEG